MDLHSGRWHAAGGELVRVDAPLTPSERHAPLAPRSPADATWRSGAPLFLRGGHGLPLARDAFDGAAHTGRDGRVAILARRRPCRPLVNSGVHTAAMLQCS